ncbi:hypothetical protein ACL1GB_12090, partial [Corynebacterium striatum]
VKHAASVRPEPGSNSPQKNFSTKAKKSGREKPKPNKKTNQPKTNTIENTTTLILNKAGKSKNYYTKKNHNHPQPDGAKKGGAVKPQKMIHAISMHTKQINLIIYNRAPKGPIRHTPHQPNTQLSQHNHDHHKVVKSTLAHY